ncbi:MAG: hypothetical protein K0R53_2921, partial [Burkholderiales bacterium]|nr:hypothetical protein [Burkholderiales bacterium]
MEIAGSVPVSTEACPVKSVIIATVWHHAGPLITASNAANAIARAEDRERA